MATSTAGTRTETELEVRAPAYHAGQLALRELSRSAKVTTAVIGRRWGKTFFAVNEQVELALSGCEAGPHRIGPGDYGWLAPSYKLANIAWDEHDLWFHDLETSSSRSERVVQILCGCRFWFLSADNPTSIRGRGFRRLTIDEGAWISRQALENAILPTLADSDGPRLNITTPAGRRGWTYDDFNRSALERRPGYAHIQRPSTDNPSPKIRAYVERMRGEMSRAAFEAEFLALFTEDAAALFKGLDACLGGALEPPAPEMHYILGVDLGKSVGRTAAEVLRLSGGPPYQLAHELVDVQHTEYTKQARMLAELALRYNRAPMIVDAGAAGAAVIDMLRELGSVVRPVTITGGTAPSERDHTVRKVDLLDRLVAAIGQAQVRIPAALGGPEGDLRRELDSFSVDVDEQGRTSYESRSGHGGGHGDRVIALALAWHGAPRRGGRAFVASGRISIVRDEEEDDDRDRDPAIDN